MKHLGVYLTMEIGSLHDQHERLAVYGIVHILFSRIAQDADRAREDLIYFCEKVARPIVFLDVEPLRQLFR